MAEITEAQARALAEFARRVIHDVCWDHQDPDGGDIQNEAERLGLVVPTEYDPAIHGDNIDADPGDRIYVFAPWLRAAAEGGEKP